MAKAKGKFILNVGDEGGILVYMQGKAVVRRLFAPSANYSDTQSFLELLASDPKAPVYMLVDVIDQSYVQHTLPPVSSLTINSLIKRKMERDFASTDLTGALQIGREKEGRKDWKYLFVTLSYSQHLKAWLDLVMEQPNHFVGIYMLPVEAEHFMLRLQEAVTGKKPGKTKTTDASSQWQLLVAHNKVGGFRQVVLKEGKLIFARLAQPIGEHQPEVIAGNIEQEISVTIEYLKRLGYSDDQGMDVYILAADAIRQAIDPRNIHVATVYSLTPYEAAEKLKLPQVAEPHDQFADILMAAAFATAKKHLLKLETTEQKQLNQLYTGLNAVKYGGSLIAVTALAATVYYAALTPGASEKIEQLQRQTRIAEEQLATVMEQEKSLPDDLEKVTDLVELHKLLNNLGAQPLSALGRFSLTRDKFEVLLKKVEWAVTSNLLRGGQGSNTPAAAAGNGEVADAMSLKLVIDMYGTEVGSVEFDRKVTEYSKALQESFPEFEVKLTSDRPGGQGKASDFSLGADDKDPILAKPYFTLEYSIGMKNANNNQSPYGG